MANKRLNATITIGGTITGGLKSALGSTKSSLRAIGDEIRNVERQQRQLGSSIQTFGRMGKDVSGMRQRYAQLGDTLDRLRRSQERLQRVENARQRNMSRRAALRGNIMDAVAIGATVAAPIGAAVSFENAMLGVAKQLDGARDKSGKLTRVYFDMAKAIQQLGRELPIPTNQIAEMVTAGLRMGVAKDQVLEFVRRSAEMATAFELPEGELAEQMGKIAGLYKIPIPAIGALADTINFLDDNAISKGGDIIEFLTRVGGVAGAVKVSSTEVAALGSTLLTLGERTETAGTATNAFFQKMAAAEKGTKKFRGAMAELGLSTTDIQKGMQSDAMGTMLRVLDAVNKLDADKRLGVLTDLIGLEHSDTIAKLATNTEELRRQLALAGSEAAKGSMSREFQARMQTTNAQWELMKNRVKEVAVNIGSVLLPALNSGMAIIGPLFTSVAELASAHPRLTKAIVGTVVALGSLRVISWGVQYACTFLVGGAIQLWSIGLRLGGVLMWLGRAVLPVVLRSLVLIGRALLLNPIGLAITIIAGGAYLIYKHWGPLKEFFSNLWAGIVDTFNRSIDWVVRKIQWVGDTWRSMKSFFGFGDAAAGAAAGPNNALPPAPPVPSRGAAVTDNRQYNFTITPQPGQSPQAIADETMKRLREREGVRQRGLLYDGAAG